MVPGLTHNFFARGTSSKHWRGQVEEHGTSWATQRRCAPKKETVFGMNGFGGILVLTVAGYAPPGSG